MKVLFLDGPYNVLTEPMKSWYNVSLIRKHLMRSPYRTRSEENSTDMLAVLDFGSGYALTDHKCGAKPCRRPVYDGPLANEKLRHFTAYYASDSEFSSAVSFRL